MHVIERATLELVFKPDIQHGVNVAFQLPTDVDAQPATPTDPSNGDDATRATVTPTAQQPNNQSAAHSMASGWIRSILHEAHEAKLSHYRRHTDATVSPFVITSGGHLHQVADKFIRQHLHGFERYQLKVNIALALLNAQVSLLLPSRAPNPLPNLHPVTIHDPRS